jgi:hypothetical protein
MIKSEDHLLDATVVPANIEYPTDAKLLNRARQWVVKGIREIRRRCDVKGKVRTYCRKAQAVYLGFTKKRKKTKAMIRLMRGKLLRYLRRNVAQLEKLLQAHGERLKARERRFLEERLKTVKLRFTSNSVRLWKTKARTVAGSDREPPFAAHPADHPRQRRTGRGIRAEGSAELGGRVWIFRRAKLRRAQRRGTLGRKSGICTKSGSGRTQWNPPGTGSSGHGRTVRCSKEKGVRGGVKALGRSAKTTENKKWLREKQKIAWEPDGRDHRTRKKQFWTGSNSIQDQRRRRNVDSAGVIGDEPVHCGQKDGSRRWLHGGGARDGISLAQYPPYPQETRAEALWAKDLFVDPDLKKLFQEALSNDKTLF